MPLKANSCPLPEVTFSAFIMSLASSALVGLGEVPDPGNGRVACDLELARHNIDLLDMLEFKLKHGLNEDETKLLESILCELRLKFVMKCDCKG